MRLTGVPGPHLFMIVTPRVAEDSNMLGNSCGPRVGSEIEEGVFPQPVEHVPEDLRKSEIASFLTDADEYYWGAS
jgi:hypothetical protein